MKEHVSRIGGEARIYQKIEKIEERKRAGCYLSTAHHRLRQTFRPHHFAPTPSAAAITVPLDASRHYPEHNPPLPARANTASPPSSPTQQTISTI
ncbi:hypothetical protein K440DRAFT_618146 [Wilcoxina mikolae CBS 423.85]|nr:hypothetical protein K440DRAFT_618146 [Wilcoxina mikolae CBS 423.85]